MTDAERLEEIGPKPQVSDEMVRVFLAMELHVADCARCRKAELRMDAGPLTAEAVGPLVHEFCSEMQTLAREIAALNEQLEEAADDRDKLDDLSFERAGEIDDLKHQVADLEEKIRFAHQEADYGATHGHEAQDTLDDVLKVLR